MRLARTLASALAAACVLGCEVNLDFRRTSGAAGDVLCDPGTTAACYDGPDGTEGVGRCRPGTKTCNADSTGYGNCTGSVTPQPEDCATPVDEDCDGSPVCTGSLAWSRRFGSDGDEIATGVAVDDAGAIFITGAFMGTVDFGGGPLVSAGGGDIFLVKLDPDGNHLWSRRFGDANGPQIATTIVVDNVGDVVIAGQFAGTLDFPSAPLHSLGESDVFVTKFNHAGDNLWSFWVGNFAANTVMSIATDGANNLLLSITSNGLLGFCGDVLKSAGGLDDFVAEFDPGGNCRWSRRFGDADDQYGSGLSLASGGDAVISANFLGSMDLGASTFVSQGGTDIALAKLTSAGDHIWSRSFGDASDQLVHDVALDGAENTIAVGSFAGTIDFGANPLPSSGDHDIFIAKLDAGGNTLWSKRFGDSGSQGADRLETDGSGNVLMAGHFAGEVNFGGESLVSAGGDDIFLAKLALDGSHIWSRAFGDAEAQSFADVAVDSGGNVVLVGSFPGSMDFGGGPLVSAGGSDIFVAKFGP